MRKIKTKYIEQQQEIITCDECERTLHLLMEICYKCRKDLCVHCTRTFVVFECGDIYFCPSCYNSLEGLLQKMKRLEDDFRCNYEDLFRKLDNHEKIRDN